MARGGIYKSEVVRARTKLIAQGDYPSIDAVRTELGNTGSKSTIHRYLKEIEEEEGASKGGKVSVSDAIQNMVDSLAAQLHEEADVRIAKAADEQKTALNQKESELTTVRQELESLKKTLEATQAALADERSRRENISNDLKNETLERTRLQQQVIDQKDRLAEEATLRKSLEEKHQHAREALEHFRQAMKEQREQEQRQHEQQVQYLQSELKTLNENMSLKLHEVMQANQENTRLNTQLSRAEGALNEARAELIQAKNLMEELEASKLNEAKLERLLVEQKSTSEDLKYRNQELQTKLLEASKQIQQQEIELTTAKAANATREDFAAQFNKFLEMIDSKVTHSESPTQQNEVTD
ncbi:MAG: integrase [Gammaproteobacteria bacterium]|nr:integrase [Gammaproteobacteria bacterium]